MDVLEPETVWVHGRRYRFFESNVWSNQRSAPYQEEYQTELDDMTSEACENDSIEIEQIDGGKFRHTLDIPNTFNGHIVGYKGDTKKKLERETKTTIRVPLKNSTDLVTITGYTKGDVISCRQRIDLLIEFSRRKIPPTHFVSIPLKNDEIVQNYESFKDRILTDSEFKHSGVVEDMFISPSKLHLTVGMLLLLDEKEMKEAADVLNECVETIVKPIMKDLKEPLMVKIQGLDYMNDDPTKVSVLYGKILPNEKLQEIANKVFGFFLEKQLMRVERTESVKLHMTVINSSKLIPIDQRRRSRRIYFNAVRILSAFQDYNFGEIEVKTLDICQRDTKEADGSYKIITRVELT
ncbi:activating signal cointegrator 1 complex subunit 1 [Diachasma alloeum]|uniref:activating signal cointegrator 1 complex subunit 1 n=1 Tax=Diachasma alloeum TaxID=454923 RepID=UPI0007382C65|nr:activating signal cointegrator 1 complex subunit 1 [Diachasma alloeum]